MRVLLDTQSWLWMHAHPDRFGGPVRELIEDGRNELLLSAASSWEIAIKWALGKLPLPEAPGAYVPSRLRAAGITPLAISHLHALRVAELPRHHGDPFDRLLIAQAQLEGLSILTSDSAFDRYDVPVIPAG